MIITMLGSSVFGFQDFLYESEKCPDKEISDTLLRISYWGIGIWEWSLMDSFWVRIRIRVRVVYFPAKHERGTTVVS